MPEVGVPCTTQSFSKFKFQFFNIYLFSFTETSSFIAPCFNFKHVATVKPPLRWTLARQTFLIALERCPL